MAGRSWAVLALLVATSRGLASAAPLAPIGAFALQQLLLQPDQAVVALGQVMGCHADGSLGPYASGQSLLRIRPDGHLDRTFGKDGQAALASNAEYLNGAAVLRRDDGKFWVAGASPSGVMVERFNAEGSLDMPLQVVYKPDAGPNGPTEFSVSRLVAQPEGKTLMFLTAQDRAVVGRLTADGLLDSTFGVAGIALVLSDTTPGAFVFGSPGATTAAGQILAPLAVFSAQNNIEVVASAVYRFGADGQPDQSFGGHGSVAFKDLSIELLAPMTDGRLLLAEASLDGKVGDLVMLGGDGQPDLAFGGTGHVALPNPDPDNLRTFAIGAAQQPDGKVVVWSSAIFNDPSLQKSIPYLQRLLPSGALDPSFAHVGLVARNLTPDRTESPVAVLLGADGTIVAGSTINNVCDPKHPFLIFRSLADGSLDPAYGVGGVAVP